MNRAAINALAQLKCHDYSKKITSFINDPNPYLRQTVVEALTVLNAREYSKEIAELLFDKDLHLVLA